MPTFGNAGTVTARTRAEVVKVDSGSEEYLHFQVTVRGVTPIFAFDCNHERKLFTTKDKPVKKNYEWTVGRKTPITGVDNFPFDSNEDGYTLGMDFTVAPLTYTYVVERRDKKDKLLKTIKDVDFISTNPADNFFEGLSVFLV